MEAANIAYWIWLMLALGLVFVELFAPTGLLLIWVALSAVLQGLITYLIPDIAWRFQLLIFTVVFLASFFAWRHFAKYFPNRGEALGLNKRSESYVGRVFTLEQPIVDGRGRIWIQKVSWEVDGPDLPTGAKIRVVETDGVLLKVEAVEKTD